jgi:hypothetical protein
MWLIIYLNYGSQLHRSKSPLQSKVRRMEDP